jgi:glycosyltransferase involved in cell wall biosynthesis
VLSDALQCGCPVLVTRVGDMGTIVDRFGTGMAVAPENKEALRRGILEMAKKTRADFHENTATALAFFSVESAVGQFVKTAETVSRD